MATEEESQTDDENTSKTLLTTSHAGQRGRPSVILRSDTETSSSSAPTVSLTSPQDADDPLASYLHARPEFLREWFLKNGSTDLIREWLESREMKPSDLNWNDDRVKGVRDGHSDNELVKSEDEALPEDTGHLTASYAEVTRTGRNSVTTELFRDMVSRHQRNGGNSSSSGVGPVGPDIRDLAREVLKNSVKGKTPEPGDRQRNFEQLNENDLLMELIRDIANELDIDRLCHKILVNVGLLTHSDRSSLFLAKGSRGQRYLVAKLFDVTPDSVLEDSVCNRREWQWGRIPPIPFGVGIAGHVALTKETVNIKDAYEDPRFNKEIDSQTGYRTGSLMCLPILNCRGDVIGVAQCINKINGDNQFTEQDAKVFKKYLTFCGIGIQNAQLFEMSVQEYKRNQLLLTLAQSIFVESYSLERLITKIMSDFQSLLRCRSCRVYLVDTEQKDFECLQHPRSNKSSCPVVLKPRKFSKPEDVLFSTVFELGRQEEKIRRLSKSDLTALSSSHLCYARHVAVTGQTYNWLGQPDTTPEDSKGQGPPSSGSNVLSLPIFNSEGKVIGVSQLVDKINGEAFTEVDISTFEAFSIFCGLGIYNTQMYESAIKLMAKQRVALEVLSYHASSSIEEMQRLAHSYIPSAEKFKLYSFQFSDLDLSDEETCQATIRMFKELDLISKFHIQYQVICRWVLSVKKNYRPVIYHNWRHAFNVTQTMFSILTTGKMGKLFSDMEIFAILVACLCHDLDHRGTNNSFQTKIESPLSTLYSTSTMEHHHFDQCIMILNSEGNNILQSLSPEDYKDTIKIIEAAILSTDLALYFKKKDNFLDIVAQGQPDWTDSKCKDLLRGMMMTACDVSAISKPWDVQKHVAELVASEFFEQGDLEKVQLNQKPIAMMDREKKSDLPKMQVEFIDCICLPVYKILSEMWPAITPLYEGCLSNREHWLKLQEESESRCRSNGCRGKKQEDLEEDNDDDGDEEEEADCHSRSLSQKSEVKVECAFFRKSNCFGNSNKEGRKVSLSKRIRSGKYRSRFCELI